MPTSMYCFSRSGRSSQVPKDSGWPLVTFSTARGDERIVTFANGMVVRELIVDVDDNTCRHSWAALAEPLKHYNASVQVFSVGPDKCRVVWIADLLPNEMAGAIGEMIQQGLNVMKQTLERA